MVDNILHQKMGLFHHANTLTELINTNESINQNTTASQAIWEYTQSSLDPLINYMPITSRAVHSKSSFESHKEDLLHPLQQSRLVAISGKDKEESVRYEKEARRQWGSGRSFGQALRNSYPLYTARDTRNLIISSKHLPITSILSSDPVKWHVKQFKKIVQRNVRLSEQNNIVNTIFNYWGRGNIVPQSLEGPKKSLMSSSPNSRHARNKKIQLMRTMQYEDRLRLVIRSSRLMHICRIPFLFRVMPPAHKPSSPSSHSSMSPSDVHAHVQEPPVLKVTQVSDAIVKKWTKELVSSFMSEYVQYLVSFGLQQLELAQLPNQEESDTTTSTTNTTPPKEDKRTNCVYLQKVFAGGLLLIVVWFQDFYVACDMYSMYISNNSSNSTSSSTDQTSNSSSSSSSTPSTSSLSSSSTSSSSSQLASTAYASIESVNNSIRKFLDDCYQLQSALHMNSFVYDFHLRKIKQFISNPDLNYLNIATTSPPTLPTMKPTPETTKTGSNERTNTIKTTPISTPSTMKKSAPKQEDPTGFPYPVTEFVGMLTSLDHQYGPTNWPKYSKNRLASSIVQVEIDVKISPSKIFDFIVTHAHQYKAKSLNDTHAINPGIILDNSVIEVLKRLDNGYDTTYKNMEHPPHSSQFSILVFLLPSNPKSDQSQSDTSTSTKQQSSTFKSPSINISKMNDTPPHPTPSLTGNIQTTSLKNSLANSLSLDTPNISTPSLSTPPIPMTNTPLQPNPLSEKQSSSYNNNNVSSSSNTPLSNRFKRSHGEDNNLKSSQVVGTPNNKYGGDQSTSFASFIPTSSSSYIELQFLNLRIYIVRAVVDSETDASAPTSDSSSSTLINKLMNQIIIETQTTLLKLVKEALAHYQRDTLFKALRNMASISNGNSNLSNQSYSSLNAFGLVAAPSPGVSIPTPIPSPTNSSIPRLDLDLFHKLISLIHTQHITEVDASLDDLITLPPRQNMSRLFMYLSKAYHPHTCFISGQPTNTTSDAPIHFVIFDIHSDIFLYLSSTTEKPLDILVCKRQSNGPQTEAAIISNVVNSILHWLWGQIFKT
eukprot:TRINITY_DN249_c0_g1_i1.p1 TRINITY_DN249_c0_g1~~TRINITY_DN249_c0_g1_i1.p1  ORF type:complete len:1157 (-),score=366.69 TRINITY_DN249_c0_g1_i1:107-3259(-)